MSFEGIISEIHAKPQIWSSSHSMFKNRVARMKIWRELAGKLNMDEEKLKKRWKHLKDQYRKELKKLTILRSGAEADYEPTWQYFSLLSFLKDEVMPGPLSSNLSDSQSNTQEIENTDTQKEFYYLDMEATESVTSPLSRPASPASQGSSRKRGNTSDDDILDIKREKLILMETRMNESGYETNLNEDEDLLFFKSILPTMKKLTDIQRLQLRGKINDWLIKAMTQNEQMFYHNSGFYNQPGTSGSS